MYYENIKSSSDGLNLSIAYSIPSEKPKGIIQISHGMAEHKERYFPQVNMQPLQVGNSLESYFSKLDTSDER